MFWRLLLLHLLGCACLSGCGRLGFQSLFSDGPDVPSGSDAGRMDAGRDASVTDSGADSAVVDAGPRDAGAMLDAETDASRLDAGVDSGPGMDATLDASTDAALDAGTDAGDAGPDAATLFPPVPCTVDVVWEVDFASDPTLLDQDNDSMPDWIVRGGGTFPASEIVNGIWTTSGPVPLDTNPARNITTTAYVDVRLRSLRTPAAVTTDFEGTLFWVNVDYTATDFVPIYVSVSRTAVDQQEVRFYGKSSNAVGVVLLGPVVTGTDILHVQMEIDPATSLLRAWIDGNLVGSATFPRVSDQLNSDQFATAFAASSPAEYDAARVAVCVP